MAKQYPDKREYSGFTILESMLVLLIVSVLMSLTVGRMQPSLSIFMETMLSKLEREQYLAMETRTSRKVFIENSQLKSEDASFQFPNGISCSPVSFSWNASGNISRAGSIQCSNQKERGRIVLQLGSGRGRVELE